MLNMLNSIEVSIAYTVKKPITIQMLSDSKKNLYKINLIKFALTSIHYLFLAVLSPRI